MSLEAMIRAIVREEITRAGTADAPDYSTADRALYPPGKHTRRAARDAIRVVSEAKRIGSVYSVSRAAYEEHHARRLSRPALRLVPAQAADDEAGVAAALAAAGLRSTRRTG